jgi:hypothetical protein
MKSLNSRRNHVLKQSHQKRQNIQYNLIFESIKQLYRNKPNLRFGIFLRF